MDETFKNEAMELPEADDDAEAEPTPADLDYELSRGALRALAMAASDDKDRPDLMHVQLLGDHEARATNGHIAAYLMPADRNGLPRAAVEGEAIMVPAEEIGRLKSESAKRGDIAHVIQRGKTLRISVPTSVQVDGQDMRQRVDVLADSYEAAGYPDCANLDICSSIGGKVFAHVSAEYLGRVASMAAALGCERLEVRRNGGDPSNPIAFLMQPPCPPASDRPLERFAVLVMPMRGDSIEPDEKPEPQTQIPGCEPRPESLTDLPRQTALATVAECRSVSRLTRWRLEEIEREDARPVVVDAIDARIAAFGGAA